MRMHTSAVLYFRIDTVTKGFVKAHSAFLIAYIARQLLLGNDIETENETKWNNNNNKNILCVFLSLACCWICFFFFLLFLCVLCCCAAIKRRVWVSVCSKHEAYALDYELFAHNLFLYRPLHSFSIGIDSIWHGICQHTESPRRWRHYLVFV